jgi:murein DD-endopeptidase MepM/ murein hydrolase activator NlpD
MARKYAFIFLGGTGTTIKQLQLSRHKLIGLGVCILLTLSVLAYVLMDYVRMHQMVSGKNDLSRQLALQTEEVAHQRVQIQDFAKEINALKEKLVQLDQFKKNIRIIANLDKSDNGNGLFGIGGSAPEDLNPNLDLSMRHQRLIKDMHQQVGQLNTATTVQRDDFESLLGKLEAQKNMLAHTPAIRPAKGWITSKFGYRQSPFTGKRELHKGLDIAYRKGSPIVATADGVVTYAGTKGLLGLVLVIDHGHGIVTRYAHLDEIIHNKGARVERGEIIAHMGNTGRSTGPHLHYEVRLNGIPVNPVKYILN